MCYTEQTWVPTLLIGLETFLGGMETEYLGGPAWDRNASLKPSLVEWKLNKPALVKWANGPLKPSLVEWKQ